MPDNEYLVVIEDARGIHRLSMDDWDLAHAMNDEAIEVLKDEPLQVDTRDVLQQ